MCTQRDLLHCQPPSQRKVLPRAGAGDGPQPRELALGPYKAYLRLKTRLKCQGWEKTEEEEFKLQVFGTLESG